MSTQYSPPDLEVRQLSDGFAMYDPEAVRGDEEDEPVVQTHRILAWDRERDEQLNEEIFETWPAIRDLPFKDID